MVLSLGVFAPAITNAAEIITVGSSSSSGLDGITMLKQRLYQRTAYRRSFSEGMAVFEMDPKSKAAEEVEELGQALY